MWKPGLANLGYALYEFLGFDGLGPARNEIRFLAKAHENKVSSLTQYLPGLLIFIGCYVSILVIFLKEKWYRIRSVRFSLFVIAGTCAVFLFASFVMKWPFWGRHLSAVFPSVVLVIGLILSRIPEAKHYFKTSLLLLFSLMLLLSALTLRFSPRHAKDDYRSAAEVAKLAQHQGKTVWWAADMAAAKYYGIIPYQLPEAKDSEIQTVNGVSFLMNPDPDSLAKLPAPALVIYSKPDIYDAHSSLQNWLSEQHYTLAKEFTSFKIWEKSGI